MGDMDDMHLAMTKELEAMRQISKETDNSNNTNSNKNIIIMDNNSNNSNSLDYDSNEEYDAINNDEFIDKQIAIKSANTNLNSGTKTSQLFRLKSTYKWDKERVEQENKDMQAQLANL